MSTSIKMCFGIIKTRQDHNKNLNVAEANFRSDRTQCSVLTFEKEVRVILEGVVRLLHGNEAGVHCLPLLAVPGLCDELSAKLQDQAEDAVDDVHDRGRFLRQ